MTDEAMSGGRTARRSPRRPARMAADPHERRRASPPQRGAAEPRGRRAHAPSCAIMRADRTPSQHDSTIGLPPRASREAHPRGTTLALNGTRAHGPTCQQPQAGPRVSAGARASLSPHAQARVGNGWGVRAERADCSLDCVPQAAKGGGGGTPSGGPTPHRHLATGRARPCERSWQVPAARPEISRRLLPPPPRRMLRGGRSGPAVGGRRCPPPLSGFIRRLTVSPRCPVLGHGTRRPPQFVAIAVAVCPSHDRKVMQVRHLGVGARHTCVALALLLRGSNIRST